MDWEKTLYLIILHALSTLQGELQRSAFALILRQLHPGLAVDIRRVLYNNALKFNNHLHIVSRLRLERASYSCKHCLVAGQAVFTGQETLHSAWVNDHF